LENVGGYPGATFSPDGRWLVTGVRSHFSFWEVGSWELKAQLPRDPRSLGYFVTFTGDGGLLALAQGRTRIEVRDAATLRHLATLDMQGWGNLSGLSLSPDGTRLAAADEHNTVIALWDLRRLRQELAALDLDWEMLYPNAVQPAEPKQALTVKVLRAADKPAPDPAEIAQLVQRLGSDTLAEWEKASKRLEEIGVPALTALRQAAESGVNAESRLRASRLVKIINAQPLVPHRAFTGHQDHVTYAVFSPDGKRILSSCDDRSLRLWDVATGKQIRRFDGHESMVTCCLFSRDGKRAISCCGWPPGSKDQSIRLWDVESGKEIRKLLGHTDCVWHLALSPDEKRLLSGARDNTLRLWDLNTGQELRRFEGHTGWVRGVAFAPDGKRIASASWDQTVRLWDVATGQEVRQFKGGSECVAFTPDGRQLLSARGGDHSILLWDVETGRQVRRLDVHREGFFGLSPDGTRLLSGSSDNTVRLWDLATGRLLVTFEGHLDPVRSALFSPDGRWGISSSHDGTLLLWEVP
jgi:WD40 repeat protein